MTQGTAPRPALAQIDTERKTVFDMVSREDWRSMDARDSNPNVAEPITRDDERDLTLEPAEPRQPTVKPLEWIDCVAFCGFGAWQIVTDDDGEFGYRFSGSPNLYFWSWETEEEAKAAVHRDFESRILSALAEGDGGC